MLQLFNTDAHSFRSKICLFRIPYITLPFTLLPFRLIVEMKKNINIYIELDRNYQSNLSVVLFFYFIKNYFYTTPTRRHRNNAMLLFIKMYYFSSYIISYLLSK